jgi:hypothetical protein
VYLAPHRSGMAKIPAMINTSQKVALPENNSDSGDSVYDSKGQM